MILYTNSVADPDPTLVLLPTHLPPASQLSINRNNIFGLSILPGTIKYNVPTTTPASSTRYLRDPLFRLSSRLFSAPSIFRGKPTELTPAERPAYEFSRSDVQYHDIGPWAALDFQEPVGK